MEKSFFGSRFMLSAKNLYQQHCVTEWVIFMVIYAIFNGFCLYLNRFSACERAKSELIKERPRERRIFVAWQLPLTQNQFSKTLFTAKMSFFIFWYEKKSPIPKIKVKICKRWQKSRFRTKTDSALALWRSFQETNLVSASLSFADILWKFSASLPRSF